MSGNGVPVPNGASLSILHLEAGGCGGCGLEFDAMRGAGAAALADAGLRLVDTPRHADLLLVSGTVGRVMLPAVDAAWAAMAEPKWLVAVGGCALDGEPFGDSYAVSGGIKTRLPVSFAIPGCPPTPDAILDGLRQFAELLRSPPPSGPGVSLPAEAVPASDASPPPDLPALLPAAPRHPLGGGGSSGG